MARYKDIVWELPGDHIETWEQVQTAVLMDIRDELKRINARLYCTEVEEIPRTLRKISANTARPRKKKGE